MGRDENFIETYFVEQVEARGGFTRKYTSPGWRGVPDRILFLPSIVVFVELKTHKGKLSKAQTNELKRLTALDIPCAVLNSPIEIDAFFHSYDEGVRIYGSQNNETA